jgi:hypothetical protein
MKERSMLKNDPTKPVTAKPQPGKAAASSGSTRINAAKTKSAPRVAARKTPASARQPDDLQQRVQQRAYELWESEGRPEGREQAHWLQAQHEIAKGLRSRAGAKL